MGKLFIAEKPDVAKAISGILGVTKKEDGYILCGEDKVTWCFGHMLQLCEPADYDEKFSNWSLDHLPIINVPWKYKVIEGRAKQLNIIKTLIAEASTIVHAGDSDDEGQLLVDEILDHYGNKKPVLRLLINDNNEKVIRKALDTMKDNKLYYGDYQSALARSVGDQLYGINMTRLYTLKAQESGVKGVFAVGRVQTPILGLIVARDRSISSHKQSFYYTIKGAFDFSGKLFTALHKPGKEAPVGENGKLDDESYANEIINKCALSQATILSYSRAPEFKKPPLPYDLLELQVDASRKYGLDPDKVLEITQSLRENHKLITYNRSDCRYLSDEQHADAANVLAAISQNAAVLAGACGTADPAIKGRAFNSANVGAHHAIVPTEASKNINDLTENERNIYLLIARAYIAQFWADKKLDVTKIALECIGEQFSASQTIVVDDGWYRLYANDKDNQEIEEDAGEDQSSEKLPELSGKDSGKCTKCTLDKKLTEPPKPYTMATILKDLKRVAKYVKNPEIKKLLIDKDKDKKGESGGIGTPATRDTFIVKLLERFLIEKKSKNIVSTELGRKFHDSLPESATQPDLTALWHQQQKDIAAGNSTVHEFIKNLADTVAKQVSEVKATPFSMKAVEGEACPICGKKTLFRLKGNNGFFWGCKDRENCGKTFPDKRGKPDLAEKKPLEASGHDCGVCNKKLIRRFTPAKKATKTTKAKSESYWYGCSGYPECKQSYFEKDGKPAYPVTPLQST